MGDDDGGQKRFVHAALLATRDHRSRAAASAASTDRLSISVSVVRWSNPMRYISSPGISVRATAVFSPHGAYCAMGLGPNRPNVAPPDAAAMCIRPVSLPMNIAER